MKANKRTKDSCYESDEQHSSSRNLDFKRNIYTKENEKEKNTSSCNESDKQH